MTDQTPSTEGVRAEYCERRYWPTPGLEEPAALGARFDAWLAKRDADRDATRDRETAAKTLRDAADALQLMDAPWPEPIYTAVQEWLNARADRIGAGDE